MSCAPRVMLSLGYFHTRTSGGPSYLMRSINAIRGSVRCASVSLRDVDLNRAEDRALWPDVFELLSGASDEQSLALAFLARVERGDRRQVDESQDARLSAGK